METLSDFFEWAWARHHNPLSWYIRPFFVLPYCWFAYRRSGWGIGLTIGAVLTSMFWFPAPEETDPRAAEFLAMEQAYAASPWTIAKILMTALIPAWFAALGWAFWRRSWWIGLGIINGGALLKVLWSFVFGGDSAWSIIPPVLIGLLVTNVAVIYFVRRRERTRGAAAP